MESFPESNNIPSTETGEPDESIFAPSFLCPRPSDWDRIIELFSQPISNGVIFSTFLVALVPIGCMLIFLPLQDPLGAIFSFHFSACIFGPLFILFYFRDWKPDDVKLFIHCLLKNGPPIFSNETDPNSSSTSLIYHSSTSASSTDPESLRQEYPPHTIQHKNLSKIQQIYIQRPNLIRFLFISIPLILGPLIYLLIRPWFPKPNIVKIGLPHYSLFSKLLLGFWFALVNPVLEEIFWRGFLEFSTFHFFSKLQQPIAKAIQSTFYSSYHMVVLLFLFDLPHAIVLEVGIFLLGLTFTHIFRSLGLDASIFLHLGVDGAAVVIIGNSVFNIL